MTAVQKISLSRCNSALQRSLLRHRQHIRFRQTEIRQRCVAGRGSAFNAPTNYRIGAYLQTSLDYFQDEQANEDYNSPR